MKKTHIKTHRLIIRPFAVDDLDGLSKILSNPKVMEFSLNGAMNSKEIQESLNKFIKLYDDKGYSMYAVVLRGKNLLIGMCGIIDQLVDDKEEHEIGYRFNEDYWGKGYATEASKAVREFGFNELGINRFISIIEDENIASIKVARKNGFTREKATNFKGFDVSIYSIEKIAQEI